jgi:hypothetical protein
MNETREDRRSSTQRNRSQTIRIRPVEPQYAEEIRTTLNASWNNLYFATSIGHYFAGMVVHVARHRRSNDPKTWESEGTVVRADELKLGRWGVAVQLARKVWTNTIG